MVSGDDDSHTGQDNPAGVDAQRRDQIVATARRALVFGEKTAEHTGPEPFEDPVMETYFLLYVLGALDHLSAHVPEDKPLDHGEKLAALAHALDAFGTSTSAEIRATVMMLDGAGDEPALKIRDEGARAAEAWADGANADAASRFRELMADPANFPRNVERTRRGSDTQ